jgi:hypothetical protein
MGKKTRSEAPFMRRSLHVVSNDMVCTNIADYLPWSKRVPTQPLKD